MQFDRSLIRRLSTTSFDLPEVAGAENLPAPYLQTYSLAALINSAVLNSSLVSDLRCTLVTAGFVALSDAPGIDAARYVIESQYSFGAAVLADVTSVEIRRLTIEGSDFPVVITPGRIDLHRRPPDPTTPVLGTSTCWVRNTIPGANINGFSWTDGILTAGHVTGVSPGTYITLAHNHHFTSPGSGTLVDAENCTIDAGIIDIGGSMPAGVARFRSSVAAPGMAADMDGVVTPSTSGTVLSVLNFPGYHGNMISQRSVIDFTGAHGDSGALVETNGTGIGLYIGDIPSSTGSSARQGVCQDLRQVERYFKVEMFN